MCLVESLAGLCGGGGFGGGRSHLVYYHAIKMVKFVICIISLQCMLC